MNNLSASNLSSTEFIAQAKFEQEIAAWRKAKGAVKRQGFSSYKERTLKAEADKKRQQERARSELNRLFK